ncbi:MAG: GDP-mannose 4,6-dehydratase [Acidimicrobiales bacterium]|nr:GDP-mannose 4,6-dehydratase [Acidimicrobiales bacterium]
MTTYLVAGAAGFIGSNFVHWLIDAEPDANIVAVDNLGFAANEPNLDTVRDRVPLEVADIADFDRMAGIYEQYAPDFIVNFAAESHNDRAINEPAAFMRANALGALNILECSRLDPVRRHLHVSTIEVYGELPDDAPYFTEASPLNAKTPYSAAKAAGDQIVRAYMQTYPQMDIAMTHCANNYGHFQLPEKLIPLMITNVLRGRKVPVYGDGLQKRDWLHVIDHCRAIHAVLTGDLPPITHAAATDPGLLPIYDVSARFEVTNLEIVERVLKALDRDPGEWIEHVADRPNHDRRYLINPAKLETQLGWSPSIDFESGLAETVDWYVANEPWWTDIFKRKGELQTNWG